MRWREERGPAAHNHSGISRKREMWRVAFGNHGRLESIAGRTRPVRCEPGGPSKWNIQAALGGATVFSKHTFSGCDVMMENRFGARMCGIEFDEQRAQDRLEREHFSSGNGRLGKLSMRGFLGRE